MSDMNEYQPDLFTLEDEDGKEQTFELLDRYTENDITYYALIPEQTEDPENEDDYFVILKRDENDLDEYLNTIDDEQELERIAEIFLSRLMPADGEHSCHDEDCDCCH